MQTSKLTPSLSLAERWSITETRLQLISVLTYVLPAHRRLSLKFLLKYGL